MKLPFPGRPKAGSPTVSAWAETLKLAANVPHHRFKLALLVLLGLGAAVAEALGVGLAVLFLFTILGADETLRQSQGLLGRFISMLGVGSHNPALIAGLLLALILASAALIYAHSLIAVTIANRVAERMRDLIHRTYVTVGYRWLQQREQGELVHTLSTESWIVADAFGTVARTAVNLGALAVFGLGLVLLSWPIALMAALSAAFTFALMQLLAAPLRRLGARLQLENQILAQRMLVSLHGMRTLRAFAQEKFILDRFHAASSIVSRLAIRMEALKALNRPVGQIGSLGALVLIAWVATALRTDVATIVASALLLFRLQPHLREIDRNRLTLASMTEPIRNVGMMLDHPDKIWPTPGERPLGPAPGEIRFEGVGFTHDVRRGPSIQAVSCSIPSGATTILSGPSGSGKSTIINLLLRLYEPSEGRITVDGEDLLSFSRESWLERLSIAGQDVELIEGTIVENIRLARHGSTLEDVRAACAAAEILADIEAIPDGFEAKIGPSGLNLSGGQRQRIGLARALVRNPDFLILDEALSAVEPDLERRIRRRIAELMKGKTVLVVSHREDLQESSDLVLRILNGRLVSETRAEVKAPFA